MIRAAFIGAGRRASGVHHPAVLRQKNVEVVAICDVIADLVERGAEELNIPRRYTDYKRMFDENDIDLVYAIVPPTVVTPIALDCLNAGKHLFIEKPAGMKSSDTALMVAAAERSDRLGAVGLQRRYEPVLTESMRLIAERGGIGTFLVEFHKSYLDGQLPFGQNSILDDGIHVADLMRHIGGGDARDVQVSRDRNFSDAVDVFAAHVHFTNGSLGVLYFLRHAGSRYLRYELHGNGISAYLRAPDAAEVYADDDAEPLILKGSELSGATDPLTYNGVLHMHRHFIECIESNHEPLTSLQSTLQSMRLMEKFRGDA